MRERKRSASWRSPLGRDAEPTTGREFPEARGSASRSPQLWAVPREWLPTAIEVRPRPHVSPARSGVCAQLGELRLDRKVQELWSVSRRRRARFSRRSDRRRAPDQGRLPHRRTTWCPVFGGRVELLPEESLPAG